MRTIEIYPRYYIVRFISRTMFNASTVLIDRSYSRSIIVSCCREQKEEFFRKKIFFVVQKASGWKKIKSELPS